MDCVTCEAAEATHVYADVDEEGECFRLDVCHPCYVKLHSWEGILLLSRALNRALRRETRCLESTST